jgi:hypothetical protein
MFLVSEAWREAYPGALAGILVMRGVVNPAVHPRIDRQREELEGELRHRFAGADRGALAALPVIQAYTSTTSASTRRTTSSSNSNPSP